MVDNTHMRRRAKRQLSVENSRNPIVSSLSFAAVEMINDKDYAYQTTYDGYNTEDTSKVCFT